MSAKNNFREVALSFKILLTAFLLLGCERCLVAQAQPEELTPQELEILTNLYNQLPVDGSLKNSPRHLEYLRVKSKADRIQQSQAAEAAVTDFYQGASTRASDALQRFIVNRPEITLSPKYPAVQEYIRMRQEQERPAKTATVIASQPAAMIPAAPATTGKELTPEQMMKLAEMKIASPAAYDEAVKMFAQAGYIINVQHNQTELPKPILAQKSTNLIAEKMKQIIFPTCQFTGASIAEALEYLRVMSREYDTTADHTGVNVILCSKDATNASLTLDLKNVPMFEALKIITELAKMKFLIDDQGVVVVGLSSNAQASNLWEIRHSETLLKKR